ncbi:PBECR4 domain-containing protein [Fructilactobacillus florum]|nr:PBECR4 domain-containing protein [Fructilactobacillus florum]
MDQLPSGIIISDESSIDFKEMLNDYRHLFAGRKVVITTNYNLLSELVIYFDVNNLPHLMGWSKVRNKNKSATRIIKDIDCGKFTKKSAKKSPLWEDIRKRNLNYNLLHRIFF